MGRSRSVFLLSLILVVHIAGGQETKPLFQLNPFSSEGIGSEESRLIVSLVQSYLSDFGQVVGNTAHESPANVKPDSYPVDYTISGTIRIERDGHIFRLEITKVKTGETFAVSSTYKNSGEIALKTRAVLESAFAAGGIETPRKQPQTRPERPGESTVTGTWKAEAGIEIVRLMEGGRGLAVFSSGAQMALMWSIENYTLRVWQISPNSERYYYPLPPETARQLALDAEPISWELSLYQNGTMLDGIRLMTAARLVNGRVTELVPGGDLREVTWLKMSR